MMKRLLSLLISIMIVLSSMSVVSFSQDSEHWAYSTVKSLIDDGIVSGDQNGNLNLDNYITRAEFVKTINKYFGFTEKSGTNFSDVSETAWYFDDMLIAKTAQYITGDQNQNANPDMSITRAEVSVIIARLLKLSYGTADNFADFDEIPDWARGAVGALSSTGIVNGYSDGTFKAGNPITRAEAFVIVKRTNKDMAEPETEANETSSSVNIFVPSGSSSSGGGGGGGGGATTPAVYKATLSSRHFDKDTKELEFVSANAVSYKIKFAVNGSEYVKELTLTRENGTYKYASFSDLVDSVVMETGINGFNADIYVNAVGRTGYSDSGYVKFGTVFLELNIPDVSDASVSYNPDSDKYSAAWSAVDEASSYKVSVFSDAALSDMVTSYDTAQTSIDIDTSALEIGTNYYIAVTAKVGNFYGNPKASAGIVAKGFGGGEGTADKPYLVYSLTHLNNIKLVSDKYFKQMADITESTPVTAPVTALDKEFTGSFDGNNKKLYVALSSEEATGTTETGFGLFPKINGAAFKNMILEGSVTGKGNVGAVAGRGTGKCTFENIINYAFVSSSNSYAAGIVARMYDGEVSGTTVTNCVNYGEIKSFGFAGGIVGVSNGSYDIKLCANYGKVYSTNTNEGTGGAGGIVATAYGNVYSSYNFGEISANKGYAGGIAGSLTKPDFNYLNCFNAGTVSGATYTAAIVTSLSDVNVPVIKNCYNIIKALKMYDGEAEAYYNNCITLNGNDVQTGISVKSAAELTSIKLSDEFTVYSDNSDNESYNTAFRYPQIMNNLIPKSFSYEDPNFKMSILDLSYDVSKSKWYVTLNPTIKGTVAKYVLSITGAEDTEITQLRSDNRYEVTSIPDGSATATLKAYDEENNPLDTADPMTVDFSFSGGIGTKESPYIITNAAQFKKAFGSTAYTDKAFVLTGFDETAMELTDYKPMTSAFKGSLVGGNIVNGNIENVKQKIKITLSLTTSDKVGAYQGAIFHQLDGATVKNLELSGTVTSSTDISGTSYLGGLTGYLGNSSTIENIDSRINITSAQDYATAGLVGAAGGGTNYITNCRNYGSVTGKKNAAGIIGDKFRTQMSGCYNYGTIDGTTQVAGITGENKDNTVDTITKCGNFGTITATDGVAGGIAGAARQPIEQCFNAGSVNASTYAGGIIGEVASGKTGNVTNCFNIGTIKGTTNSGLAIGNLAGTSTVSNFYDLNNPSVTSLAGNKTGTLTATNAYSYGENAATPANDAHKTTKNTIKALTGTVLKDTSIWTKTAGYNYPDLKNSSIVLKNENNVTLPE